MASSNQTLGANSKKRDVDSVCCLWKIVPMASLKSDFTQVSIVATHHTDQLLVIVTTQERPKPWQVARIAVGLKPLGRRRKPALVTLIMITLESRMRMTYCIISPK
uniref:Uncharacterized protein n=1 Tax=Nelumbo nucifera TaxID=4432 RepID=A0A822YNC4_NELNU|nr:TPA_asm: hypothetical protein HUJ06_011366 [Nelumbo nucifera]